MRARRRGARRAIVTGGAGFVGSHLVDRLIADGMAVLVLDDLSTGRADQVAPESRFERVDIATDALDVIVRDWRPSVVFHLAAQASVPLSIAAPLRDLAVNVIGTQRVCSAARSGGVGRVVFVSSGGAIYGEGRTAATERRRPAPASYYGVHKLAAEGHVALSGLPYAIARPSNIYGPRQVAGLDGGVVASFVEQALTTGRLRVNGDGTQTRDFLDVRDAVDALCRLASDPTPGGVWNLASGQRRSIGRLADAIDRAMGRPIPRDTCPARAGDVTHSAISAARMRRLGWRAERDIEHGVAELIELAAAAQPG